MRPTMKKAKPTSSELLATLAHTTSGLLFPSESDAPLTPFHWEVPAGTALSPEALLVTLGLPAGTKVETTTVADTLGPFAEAGEGASPEDEADARRFQAIIDLLERELGELRVYRVGEVDIDVYLLGQDASGAWLGLKTHAVET